MPTILAKRRFMHQFTPDHNPGLELWFDALDQSTMRFLAPNRVAEWRNKGAGSHFVQFFQAYRPTLTANILNGRNALLLSNRQFNPIAVKNPSNEWTIFYVGQPGQNTTQRLMVTDADGAPSLTMTSGDKWLINNSLSSVASFGNTAQITTFRIRTSNPTMTFWGNGSERTESNTAVSAWSESQTMCFFSLVDRTQSLQGYIGELILYNVPLNDDQRRNVEQYLSVKWGIPA